MRYNIYYEPVKHIALRITKGNFMNKKVKRAHDKAMSYYEMGQIDKALEICEDILLEGLDNPNVLNFKGLLLYQKVI